MKKNHCILNSSWYFEINRAESDSLLSDVAKEEGTFLIRKSDNKNYKYTLSVRVSLFYDIFIS